jgi:hypothetical protein
MRVSETNEVLSAHSRRAILAAGLGGLGAVVASAVMAPARVLAATGDPVLAGHSTSADTETDLTSTAVNFGGYGPASSSSDAVQVSRDRSG